MNGKMKTLFTISVVLNVLLIATHVGMFVKNHNKDRGWKGYTHELSEETRSKVRASFQESKEEFKQHMQQVKDMRAELDEVLQKEEFDRDAFMGVSDRMHELFGDMMSKKVEKLADLLADVPVEERSALAKKFMRPPGHHKHGDRYKRSRDREEAALEKMIEKSE